MTTRDEDVNKVSPIIASAQGASKDQMKMAGTDAAKQGAGLGTYFGVKGNVHETPNLAEPVEAPKKVTERSRILQKGLEAEDAKLEAEKESARGMVSNSQLLMKSGTLGASMQAAISAKIGAALEQRRKDASTAGDVGAEVLGLTQTDEQAALAAKYNADPSSVSADELGKAGIVINKVTGKAVIPAASYATINKAGATTEEIRNAVADLAYAAGKVDANGKVTLSVGDVAGLFAEGDDKLAKVLALAIPDQIRIFDTDGGSSLITDMGYSPSEIISLKGLLGLTEEDTVQDFQAKVAKYRDTTFAEITSLEGKLLDPAMTSGEKAEIRERLKDLGYVGMLGNRERVEVIAQAVEAADKNIEFGGETFDTLEDLLSDKRMAGIISRYLSADPEDRDDMDLPDSLRTLIDENKQLFNDAVYELKEEVAEFEKVQTVNRDVISRIPEVAGTLYDTTSAYWTGEFTGSLVEILSDPDVDEKTKTNISAAITAANAISDNAVKTMAELTPADLKTLAGNTDTKDAYLASLSLESRVDDILAEVASGSRVDDEGSEEEWKAMAQIFDVDPTTLHDTLSTLIELEGMGVLTPEEKKALDTLREYYKLGMKGMLDKMKTDLSGANKAVASALGAAINKMSETVQSTSVLLAGKTDAIKGIAAAKKDPNSVSYEDLMKHLKTLDSNFDPANPSETLRAMGLDAYLPKAVESANAAMEQGVWTSVGVTDWDNFFETMEDYGGFGGFKDPVTKRKWNKAVNDTLIYFTKNPPKPGSKEDQIHKRLLRSVVASPNPIKWEDATRLAKTKGIHFLQFDAPVGGGFDVLFEKDEQGKYKVKHHSKLDKRHKDILQDFMRLLNNVQGVISDPFSVKGMAEVRLLVSKSLRAGVHPYNPKQIRAVHDTLEAKTTYTDFLPENLISNIRVT